MNALGDGPDCSAGAPPAKAEISRRRARLRILGILIATLGLVVLVSRLPLLHSFVLGARWARGAGLFGALAGGLSIVGATLLFMPIVPLIILSGWVWGAWGAVVALSAATVSAMGSFSIARALGQSAVARLVQRSERAAKIFALAESGGPLTVAILRLAPIIPFTPGNATLGLTRLTLRDMAVGTPLGLLPGAAFYIWMGTLLPDAEAIERGDAMKMLFQRGWLLAAVFASHLIVAGLAALLARKMHARRAS